MVQIINQQKKYKIREGHFRHLLKELISLYALPEVEVSLVFTDNSSIRHLNRQFRKKDRPTDVLSFSIGEKGVDGHYYLGDIIISVPQAYAQCGREKTKLEKELERLVIHGFLHLLGHDHGPKMNKEELRLKNYFGIE